MSTRALLLTSLLLLALHIGSLQNRVNAIDLNPFKTKDTKDTKDNPQLHLPIDSTTTKQLVMDDASTGTVISMEPPQPKEPVSCNEIMAKAVVIASEEKEMAVRDKNSALADAAKANARADQLADIVNGALAEAKNATVEYEALKLMADRLVNEAKRDKEVQIESIQRQTQEELQVAKKEFQFKQLQLETASQLVKDEADAQLKNAIEEAGNQLLEVQQKARADVQLIKNDMVALGKDNEAQIQLVKNEMVALGKDNEARMERVKNESEDLIKTVRDEAKDTANTALGDARRMVNEALETSYRIERSAELTAKDALHRAESTVANVHKAAREEYERIQAQANDDVEEVGKRMQKQIDALDQKLMEADAKAAEQEKQMQSTIETQKQLIASFEKTTVPALEKALAQTKEEMEYWRLLHDHQGFVNTTLVVQYSSAALQRTLRHTKDKVQEGSDILMHRLDTISQTHGETVKSLYREHLKETMDEKVMPFYSKHVAPTQKKVQQKFLAPATVKCKTYGKEVSLKLEELAETSFRHVCVMIQPKATGIKTFLLLLSKSKSKGGDKFTFTFRTPDCIISFLEDMEQDSSDFVSVVMKVVAVLVLYKMRHVLLSLALWVLVVLPFRFIWFFCPLRLLITIGGTGGKKDASNSKAGGGVGGPVRKISKSEDEQ